VPKDNYHPNTEAIIRRAVEYFAQCPAQGSLNLHLVSLKTISNSLDQQTFSHIAQERWD
jgi:hypothetical protein